MREMTIHELKADVIFFTATASVAFLAVLLFDIHWSFYPGERVFPPSRWVGITPFMYTVWTVLGGFLGIAIAKIYRIGFREEARAHRRFQKRATSKSAHEEHEDSIEVAE